MSHKSVLVEEVLQYLEPSPGKTYLDATFGAGGHTRAILESEPACKVIAMDWDRDELDKYGSVLQEEFPGRLTLIWGNFALLYKKLKKIGVSTVDGVLADFGTSQMQLDHGEGFSIYSDTPLDMRMSPADHRVTAAAVVNFSSEEKLRQIFWQLGQEMGAKRIAHAILEERAKKRFETTGDLVRVIESVSGRWAGAKIHPATKVFQALRIFVNDELKNIESLLAGSLRVLNPGGRLVFISFHSLEDRLVKRFLKGHIGSEASHSLRILTPKAVSPGDAEVTANRSARSAKLRAAEMLD